MKKEAMDILQNELVFDRLSGSAGDITAVSMGDKHYFRKKGKTECPNTERQQRHHQVTAREVAVWQSMAMDKQEQWNRWAGRSGRIPPLSMMGADCRAIICSCPAFFGLHPPVAKVFLSQAAVRWKCRN